MIISDLKIAKLTYRIESDVRIHSLHDDRFQRFRVNSKKPDITHHFRLIPPISCIYSPLEKKEKNLISQFSLHHNGKLDSPILSSPIIREKLLNFQKRLDWISLEINPSSLAIFDFSFNHVDIFFTPELIKILENSYMGFSTFAQFLHSFSAAMIHSSAIIFNDSAALFLAKDGGGKTTIARLSRDYPILCDDQVVLRREGAHFFAYGTPWGLMINNSLKARVGGFFLLEQAEHFELIPLEPEDILYYFWNEHLSNIFFIPKYLKCQYFKFLCDIVSYAPAYRLRFAKDNFDWDVIKSVMSS